MLDTYTVSFFGHRIITDLHYSKRQLEKIISNLIQTKDYLEFLIGRNGDFDISAAAVIRCCTEKLDLANTTLTLVLPYQTADLGKNEKYYLAYYDEIEVCSASASAHYKAAFSIRNKYMIDRSDLVICCIEHTSGGAYKAVEYAISKNKPILNTASNSANISLRKH
ncbi:MAG: hypothetical protein IJ736_06780 [Firmicutes bacterium]|nr:hypothetical protein [Bacillota bacterium]